MIKRVSILVVACFSFWIMPLGAFIDKSDEEQACFGKRAICLCSQLIAKQIAKKYPDAPLIKNLPESSKSMASGFSSNTISNAITLAFYFDIDALQFSFNFKENAYYVVRSPLEPVPKA